MSAPTAIYPTDGDVYYGRSVWTLGEDGDEGFVAEGHGQRALAAINAHYRREGRWLGWDERPQQPGECWVVFQETCGCTPDQHAEHQRHPDYNDDPWGVCDNSCPSRALLPPCATDPETAWLLKYVNQEAPGALPVTVVEP